jgi:hypothetical protein
MNWYLECTRINVQEYMRIVGVDDSGAVYAPVIYLGNEAEGVYRAVSDGESLEHCNGHAYARVDWLRARLPSMKAEFDRFERNARLGIAAFLAQAA